MENIIEKTDIDSILKFINENLLYKTIENISETKSWLFVKINKIEK